MESKPSELLFPYGIRERRLYFVICIVFTVIDFAVARLFQPTSQESGPHAVAQILLSGEPAQYLFPFLFFSMLCLGLLLLRPTFFSRWWWVRLGIYTGVLVAITYAILVIFAMGLFLGGIALMVILITLLPVRWIYGRLLSIYLPDDKKRFVRNIIISVIVLVGLFALFIDDSIFQSFYLLIWVLLYLLLIAPFWVALLYRKLALHLWQTIDQPQMGKRLEQVPMIHALIFWLAGYVVTWSQAILEAQKDYAALPAEHCYIATAASHGHTFLVGSRPVQHKGRTAIINRQLQILKCGEIALMVQYPALHKRMRHVYNTAGPKLASRIRSPWIADLAYLLLKPAEWATWNLLYVLLPDVNETVKKMY